MRVSIIAAVAENGIIGIENRLPWRLPADLRHFKALTLGHHLIMGRKTFEGVGALPGRTTIVVSRRGLAEPPAGVQIASSVPEALDLARRAGETESFIAGGAEIYRAGLDYADRMYVTLVEGAFSGDAHFPEFDAEEWVEIEAVPHEPDEKNPHPFTFVTLERRVETGFG